MMQPLPDVLQTTGTSRVAFGMFGPLIAAVIMLLFVSREGLKGTLGFRRPRRFYAVAFAGPAVFVTSVILVDHITALGRFVSSQSLMFTVPTVLVIGSAVRVPLTIGEEYGWRGYLLPRLLPLGETRATVVLAAIWAIWHTPILLIGLNYPNQPLWMVLPVFAVTITLLAFPFTWLYVDSRQSVLVVAVMHSVLNATGDTFTSSAYIRGANPLLVSGGGLVGAAILLQVIVICGAHRTRLVVRSPIDRRHRS
jgi:uncharacterized protein